MEEYHAEIIHCTDLHVRQEPLQSAFPCSKANGHAKFDHLYQHNPDSRIELHFTILIPRPGECSQCHHVHNDINSQHYHP